MDKKKEENNLVIIFLVSFLVLNLVGYLFDIDILKLFVHNGNSRTTYFVSVYISFFISIIYYISYRLITKNKKK